MPQSIVNTVKSIVNTVKNRIFGHGRGWVFTAHNFSDLGSDSGVRTALSRLQEDKVIRRVFRGIYDYPKTHEVLGLLSPSTESVAKAYADRSGAKIQATGAYAANVIGFSEQVPGRATFLTNGPTGKVKIKNLEVVFRKTTVKNMFAAGSREALLIQALKFMGPKHVDDFMLEKVKKLLKGSTRKDFKKNIQYAPHWIRELLFKLMENELGYFTDYRLLKGNSFFERRPPSSTFNFLLSKKTSGWFGRSSDFFR